LRTLNEEDDGERGRLGWMRGVVNGERGLPHIPLYKAYMIISYCGVVCVWRDALSR